MNNNKQILSATEIFKAEYKKRSGKDADETVMQHMDYCIRAMHIYAEQFDNKPIPQQPEQNECIADLNHWPCACPKCNEQPEQQGCINNYVNEHGICFCIECNKRREWYWDNVRENKPELYDEIAKYGITSEPEQQADGGEYDAIIETVSKEINLPSFPTKEFREIWMYPFMKQAVQQERERVEKLQFKVNHLTTDVKFRDEAIETLHTRIEQLQSQLEQTKARKVKWPSDEEIDNKIGMIHPSNRGAYHDAIMWYKSILKKLNPEVE